MNRVLVYVAVFFATTISTAIHATAIHATEPLELHAGVLTMQFEPDNAMLRNIRVGEHLVLLGITAPVRNESWGTVPPQVQIVKLEKKQDSFDLTFDVRCQEDEIDFSWKGRITGHADGKLTFTFAGEARSTFLRNRIGFCVLHGANVAGIACRLESVDGRKYDGKFPKYIAPHQPFKNLRTVSHEVQPGVTANVRMLGDTFEMEDQRNWTDASFKTYCTPLEIPYPVRIEQGTRVSQKIEISIDGIAKVAPPSDGTDRTVKIRIVEKENPTIIPAIGLQVSSQNRRLTPVDYKRLQAVHLRHLRVDIRAAEKTAVARLRRAIRQAKELDVDLIVGLEIDDVDQSTDSVKELSELADPEQTTFLLLAATAEKTKVVAAALQKKGHKLGVAEKTNFTELNRNRPEQAASAVAFGVNPQIHAFDDLSMIETLEIQGQAVESAREFVGETPLLVSPITLRNQANREPRQKGSLPPHVDPRQTSEFAAAWTLGSLKYLSEAGANKLTYFETVGWLGLFESEVIPERSGEFPSTPGQLFPAYHVFKAVGEFQDGQCISTTSSHPLRVVGMTLKKGDRRVVLLANLTSANQQVVVGGIDGKVKVASLYDTSASQTVVSAASEDLVLSLPPHGITVIDQ